MSNSYLQNTTQIDQKEAKLKIKQHAPQGKAVRPRHVTPVVLFLNDTKIM